VDFFIFVHTLPCRHKKPGRAKKYATNKKQGKGEKKQILISQRGLVSSTVSGN
jgi:hypothetical protein